MKKQFLLVSAMMLISAGAFAQWVKPVVETQPVLTDGTAQYLYNVEYDGFLLGANNWGTRASVSKDHGWQWRFTKNEDNDLYMFQDYNEAKGNKWMNMMCETPTAIYTDAASQPGQVEWNVVPAEGNYFKIQNLLNDGEAYANMWFAWDNEGGTATVVNMVEGAEATALWASVSEEAYQSYITAGPAYLAALKLEETIAEAKAAGVDASAAEEVYGKYNVATKEELDAAQAELTAAIAKAAASVENPVDMSGLIVNATFDNITYEGWNGSGFGSGGTTGPCAERYNMNFDTWQEIKNLPNGVYAVSVDGFYRWGSIDNAFKTKGEKTPAYVYGTNGTDLMSAPIQGLFDCISPDQPVEGTSVTHTDTDGNVYYIPNSMADACKFFDAGYYKPSNGNNMVYFGVTDGVAKIGVKKDVATGTDWTLVDNFTLTYYGSGDDAYTMWNEHLTSQMKDYDNLETEGITVTESYVEEYNKIKNEVQAPATDHATVVGNVKKLSDAEAAIEANIQAWKDLVAQQNLCAQEAGDLYGDDADNLKDYLEGDLQDKINDHELSTEDVLAEIQTLKDMLKKATENGIVPGKDLTNLIKNPSFKDGFTGWTNSEGQQPIGNVGGLDVCKNVEVYENKVDVQQIIEGLPKGVYKLECQAFERPTGNGSYTGEELSKVYLYMNSAETPVQNIVKDAIDDEKAINKQNCYNFTDQGTTSTGAWPYDYYVEGAGWVPNSMDGASYAFAGGRYNQEAVGLVTDGKMTIGLTSKGVNAHWVLWAGFKLTYVGMGAEDVKPTLDAAIASLETDMVYGSDVKAKVDEAIDNAKAAATGAEMVDALDALYQLKEAQATSIEKFQKLSDTCETASDAIEEDERYAEATAEQKEAALTVVALAADGIGTFTDAEADAALDNIANALAKLVLPANIGEATSDNPVSVTRAIVNASFEEGNLNGWEYFVGGDTQAAENSNGTYTVDNADGNYVFNTWSSSAPADGFWIKQTVRCLPAGTYKISALLASDAGNKITLSANEVAEEFVMEGAKNEGQEVSVVVILEEEGSIEIKATSPTWYKADNFRLDYYGEGGDPTSIQSVKNEKFSSAIYDINGVQMATLRKGVNIVRTSEGKVVKVLVK